MKSSPRPPQLDAEPAAAMRSSLLSDVRQLGRVLSLRVPQPQSFSPAPGKLIVPVVLYFVLALAAAMVVKGTSGSVYYQEALHLLPFGEILLVAVLVAAVGGFGNRQGGRLLLVLVWLLALAPVAELYSYTVWEEVESAFDNELPAYAIALVLHGWLALAGAMFVAHALRIRRQAVAMPWFWCRGGAAFVLAGVLLFAVLAASNPFYVWAVESTVADLDYEADSSRVWLKIDEKLLYAQPRLLAEKLASIAPGTPGKAEIFFLGAGGSEQGVFMREVITVEDLFRERYATAGHSLILVNNAATAERLPFANLESLRQALGRVGAQMNGEEDLLFLFLTSHGSKEHALSFSLHPFGFADLDPPGLRAMLDEAGIARRVVVVSACYSGGFIPALADEHTLVITASAADRNSFGCNDSNELTDFGRAYFDEALRQTRSFTAAFARAQARVAEREAEADLTPSLPQMAGGEALAAQLADFARE
ncbi:hypothetical protein AGMMS49543_17870 [Betaproteobacteria bacterium]|nr:hypothetical protein AGMMS49543_17870 [Betaproteobacteria bacterium]GHU15784.1 hypothetical protein AGMMS50243_00180 [Betaproteobacteria bacterium]